MKILQTLIPPLKPGVRRFLGECYFTIRAKTKSGKVRPKPCFYLDLSPSARLNPSGDPTDFPDKKHIPIYVLIGKFIKWFIHKIHFIEQIHSRK